ncbi:DUF4386 domain-containing protein [Demequina sp.]|uniref:DUF4386 domain-containing protein n=1 Tax=Demequina sp. TaxID=2050685 RepID=UPI003D0F70C9
MTTDRRLALIAGLLYLITHVTSVGAVVAYGSALDDPTASSATRLALGAALEFALALACLGTGVVLLPLLRRGAPVAATAFAAMRTMEAAVIAAGIIPVLTVMWLVKNQSDAVAGLGDGLAAAHDAAFLVGQGLIISINTFVLAFAQWKSAIVPVGIPVLGALGAALVLSSNLMQLFGAIPLSGAVAGALALPIFAFEIWFALYLVFKGVRPR